MNADTHLAEFNWATLRADPDAPEVAEFIAALDRVHAIAERSEGFVWRLGAEASAARAIGWPMFLLSDRIIASFSVWEDTASLERFVYRTLHGGFLRRGGEWFARSGGPTHVLWTVPRGHIPDMTEARARVEHLLTHGPSDHAFDFAHARQAVEARV